MTDTIDITQSALTRRFARLLAATRERQGQTLQQLADASDGRFARSDLEALEEGIASLDDRTMAEATALYGADLGLILPLHPTVQINGNVLSSGAASTVFNPVDATSLLASYLVLLRQLRRQRTAGTVGVRHDDVEALARHTGLAGWVVVERLAELMGLDDGERRAMVDLFASGTPVVALLSFDR